MMTGIQDIVRKPVVHQYILTANYAHIFMQKKDKIDIYISKKRHLPQLEAMRRSHLRGGGGSEKGNASVEDSLEGV